MTRAQVSLDSIKRLETPSTAAARYGLLVEAVTDYAITMLDPEGLVLSWNAGARRFKGYEGKDIIGTHFSVFHTAEERAAGLPERALATAAREGKFETEGWRVRKDGSRFWAHVVIDPIWSPSGELIGFAQITRDLSERRAAQALLQRSEDQFRLLVQSVTDYAIYMLDGKGRVSSWNPGAERIKGYRPEEIIGRHFSIFYTDADRAAGVPEQALAIAAAEGRYEKEGFRVRKDGTQFRAHVVIDPIRDERGAVIGFAKVTRDVTERHVAQESLERARRALAQSQKMDALGQLTGGVAHDFNNLLMVILASLDQARKRIAGDDALLRLIDDAMQSARRGAALTNRMLVFARRHAVELRSVDLPLLVRDLVEMLQRSIGPMVTIETDFPPRLARVHADQNQLETALLNLAVNARDAMPKGGRIRIGARDEAVAAGDPHGLPPGAYVCLSVADEGEGMDPEVLARATEPFFTTKDVSRGTGLGLAMVHGVAEQAGGRLVLKSAKGAGTTAEIWLPAAPDEAEAAPPAGDADAADSLARPLRVLAVDDDELVLLNTVAMLEDLGHQPLEARSAMEALAVLEREPVDLVVTDQVMPRMSGVELIARMRERWPGLPAILATGYAEVPGGAPKAVRLSKPYLQADLAGAIALAVPAGSDRAPAAGTAGP